MIPIHPQADKCKSCGQQLDPEQWMYLDGKVQDEYGQWWFSGIFCNTGCFEEWFTGKSADRAVAQRSEAQR